MAETATPVVDNQSVATESLQESTTPVTPTTDSGSMAFNWQSGLKPDLKGWINSKGDLKSGTNSFDNNSEGLNKMVESYANLEKLLGHEKVPIPKDPNDVEGWNRFSKAMGIPDKAEGYGLPDAQIPESMKDLTIDKNKFAEVMHAHKVHPSAVKGIWNTYQQLSMDAYKTAMEQHQKTLNETVNRLKGEWGDAYESKVELAQLTINKFSPDQEMNDWLTATLLKHPYGVKYAAAIGEQFAENKIGEFQMKRFSLAPDEAQEELNKIRQDPNHAYTNPKASDAEHQRAVDYVNSLIATINRAKQNA